ncbi:MAG: hypothetical protein AAF787_19930 [Chloroflexota bacterium]
MNNERGCNLFGGIFKTLLRGGLMSLGGLGMCLCGCAVPLVLIGWGISVEQQAVIERNNGHGTQDQPIARGEWVRYSDMSIRAAQVIADGTNHPDLLDELDPAAAGSVYTLIWFELYCRKDEGECMGSDFRAWLVDSRGREWQEPPNLLVFSRDDLDFEEAMGGNTVAGWQVFEVPRNADFDFIKISRGGVTLYARY